MASMRDIQRRKTSIQSTGQITKAMKLVSTVKLQKAKTVAAAITEEYEPDVKMLKAELLLNEGNLEEAQGLLNSIEDADDLAT